MTGKQLPEDVDACMDCDFGLLRVECRERGFTLDHCSDLALAYVMAACQGDIGLAADTLAMVPRPMWAREFVGP
jgi:hypothetical protein